MVSCGASLASEIKHSTARYLGEGARHVPNACLCTCLTHTCLYTGGVDTSTVWYDGMSRVPREGACTDLHHRLRIFERELLPGRARVPFFFCCGHVEACRRRTPRVGGGSTGLDGTCRRVSSDPRRPTGVCRQHAPRRLKERDPRSHDAKLLYVAYEWRSIHDRVDGLLQVWRYGTLVHDHANPR